MRYQPWDVALLIQRLRYIFPVAIVPMLHLFLHLPSLFSENLFHDNIVPVTRRYRIEPAASFVIQIHLPCPYTLFSECISRPD